MHEQSGQLSNDTRRRVGITLGRAAQPTGNKKGAWLWLRFANEPWEADVQITMEATLCRSRGGHSPGSYRARLKIQDTSRCCREYLTANAQPRPPSIVAVLFVGFAKVSGLLRPEKAKGDHH